MIVRMLTKESDKETIYKFVKKIYFETVASFEKRCVFPKNRTQRHTVWNNNQWCHRFKCNQALTIRLLNKAISIVRLNFYFSIKKMMMSTKTKKQVCYYI